MKTIKIRHFYKKPILLILLSAFTLPIVCFFVASGICQRNMDLATLGGLLLLIYFACSYVFFLYGIKITPKRVLIVNNEAFETFRYEDINYIKIEISDVSMTVEIKQFRQKPEIFVFSDFHLSFKSYGHLSLSRVSYNVSKKRAEKMVAKLSQCEKVRITNFFEEESNDKNKKIK